MSDSLMPDSLMPDSLMPDSLMPDSLMPDSLMNDSQRLQLQNMIQANNTEDQTDLIRKLKHSVILRTEINQLLHLMATHGEDSVRVHEEGTNDCPFLFTYYTDIYNKVRKQEIDVGLLFQLIDVLKRIEDGELDQHEGSFCTGTILKQIYVDSALKKAEKLDKLEQASQLGKLEGQEEPKPPMAELSYKAFKQTIQKKTEKEEKK